MGDSPVFNRSEAQAQARDNLARNLRNALDDTEELIRLTAEQAGERIAAARNRAKESVSKARIELDRVQMQAVERAKEAAQDVDTYVRENPWKTMALAGVLSAVIGLLISRR